MDVERIRPIGNIVLVKPDKAEDRTKGGLWIPDNAKQPTGTGRVVAMGPGLLTSKGERWGMPDLKPGDRVIYDAKAPFPRVTIDGTEYIKLRDDTVLAVLEE